jgi:hypothetical protein
VDDLKWLKLAEDRARELQEQARIESLAKPLNGSVMSRQRCPGRFAGIWERLLAGILWHVFRVAVGTRGETGEG